MKIKLLFIILCGSFIINLGLVIDNIRLENELRDSKNVVGKQAMELVNLYNQNDLLWEECEYYIVNAKK